MRPCRRNGVTPFDTTQRFGNCRPSLLAVLDVLLNPAQACANKAWGDGRLKRRGYVAVAVAQWQELHARWTGPKWNRRP